jgi:hypothetical protein
MPSNQIIRTASLQPAKRGLCKSRRQNIPNRSRNPREGGDLVFRSGSGGNQIPAFAGISVVRGLHAVDDPI